MFPVTEELKGKLEKLNISLRQSYPQIDKKQIRQRLEEVGRFYKIEKWSPSELKNWLNGKSIVGVDGSVNSTKGNQTRTLSVFQALAKSTKSEEKWAANIHTSLLGLDEEWENGLEASKMQWSTLLSTLEMKVSLEAIEEWDIQVILMDGSLHHFQVENSECWSELSVKSEQKGIYLMGVSEEICTRDLTTKVYPEYRTWTDRELLYGTLQVGEAYEWEDWNPTGSMWKMAFRPSLSPQPIGVDGQSCDKKHRFELMRLIHTLTPQQGRGIPFWLDIVDQQVRVTDSLVNTLVDQYIDPDLRHRLFVNKRSDRIL